MKFSFSRIFPDIQFFPSRYISHLLIVVSIIITFFAWSVDSLLDDIFTMIFGMKQIGINMNTLPFILGKIVLFQFIHGNMLHLVFNSFFLYQAGPEVESRMKRREYIQFFLGGTLFVALCLWFLAPLSLTIGISGWCMALLAYLYMDLSRIRHPMANEILTMLILNIALGFIGNISFVGHASGAVWGLLWWMWRKN